MNFDFSANTFEDICFKAAELQHNLDEHTQTICDYLNHILEVVPDFIYNANDDTIRIKGFYVDELGRFRYETND